MSLQSEEIQEQPKAETPAKREKTKKTEKFYEVIFSHKASANDTRDVQLTVNGETLVIKRQEKIVIPERYIEVAKHATYQTFTQEPGKDRKITGYVNVYPFTVIREATEQEYRDQLKAGNEISRRQQD